MANEKINLEELRRLKMGGAVVMDRDEMSMINRIQNAQEGQVELAKQQLRNNARQMQFNVEAQRRANEQWRLVFALDIYKFHRSETAKTGLSHRQFDAELDEQVCRVLREEFAAPLDVVGSAKVEHAPDGGFTARESADEAVPADHE